MKMGLLGFANHARRWHWDKIACKHNTLLITLYYYRTSEALLGQLELTAHYE